MILIIGNFGYHGSGPLGGQNVRTRSIHECIRRYSAETVEIFDVSGRKPLTILKLIYLFTFSKTVIVIPGKFFFSIMIKIPPIFYETKRFHLVAVGGWLHEFNDEKRFLKVAQKFSNIFVQTHELKNKLSAAGVSAQYLPNFKFYSEFLSVDIKSIRKSSKIEIAFSSRVSKDKGIHYLIEALSELGDQYHLFIYGPLQGVVEEELSDENITYCGMCPPEDVPKALTRHDIFVFPTFHKGEGFPGALLDGMAAGLPIIATDWRYNKEIVSEKMGILVRPRCTNDIVMAIKSISADKEVLSEMGRESLKQYQKFKPEIIGSNLVEYLNCN